MILHFLIRIHFRRFVRVAELDELAAGTVTAGHVDESLMKNRGRNDGRLAGPITLPQQIPGFRVESKDELLNELNVLASATMFGNDDRCVLSSLGKLAALPDLFSGLSI